MYQVNIEYRNLLALFMGFDTEQPFRHQSAVELFVDFTEYRKLIELIVHAKADLLYLPLSKYEDGLAQENENLLCSLFYFDLSRAVCGEVALSILAGKESTAIIGTFDDYKNQVVQIPLSDTKKLSPTFLSYKKASVYVKRELSRAVGDLSDYNVSRRNSLFIDYVIILRALSFERYPGYYELKGGL